MSYMLPSDDQFKRSQIAQLYSKNEELRTQVELISLQRRSERYASTLDLVINNENLYLDGDKIRVFPTKESVAAEEEAKKKLSKARKKELNAERRQSTRRFWGAEFNKTIGAFVGGGAGAASVALLAKALGWL